MQLSRWANFWTFDFQLDLGGIDTGKKFRWIPFGFVAHHRPADHRDLPCQRDAGLLFASRLATADAIVRLFGPGVVARAAPGAFQQDASQGSRPAFADSSVPIDLT